MIFVLKVLLCAVAAIVITQVVFRLLFVRLLKCEKCGAIVAEEDYRAHKYKCDQRD